MFDYDPKAETARRKSEAKRFIAEHDDLELYLHELNRHEYWGVREANGLNTEFLSIREVAYALIDKGENPNKVAPPL